MYLRNRSMIMVKLGVDHSTMMYCPDMQKESRPFGSITRLGRSKTFLR